MQISRVEVTRAMSRTSIFLPCLILASVPLMHADLIEPANVDPPAQPPPCIAQTLDNYIALMDGCIIGDKVFYNFGYSQTGGGIAATAVNVTPEPVQPDGVGIDFGGNWSGTLQNTISFSVRTLSGMPTINDALLGVTGMAQTQKASFTDLQSLCLGRASFPMVGNCATSEVLTATSIANSSRRFASFNPVSVLATKDALSLSVFQAGGETSVSSVDNFFSEIPEPSLFVAIGLIGGALIAWRVRWYSAR